MQYHVIKILAVLTIGLVAAGCGSRDDDGSARDTRVDQQADAGADVEVQPPDSAQDGEAETTPDVDPDACLSQCDGMECGWDGCGGTCGECVPGQVCNAGTCCAPNCDGKACGPDGCSSTCGTCADGDVCVVGSCCTPNCSGMECGRDGCGGWCGVCDSGSLCVNGDCAPDSDLDGVPDEGDPAPNDASFPGNVMADRVYAHTRDKLFSMDVKTFNLEEICEFQWPGVGDQGPLVTDIAIDQYGVLYAVTFDAIYVCHPETCACQMMGGFLVDTSEDSYNGLTLIPQGYLDPFQDTLVAITKSGAWYRLYNDNGDITASPIGSYGFPYTSAGDVFSIFGVGTYAAVHKEEEDRDFLLRVNPSNAEVLEEIGPIGEYDGVFGLAGWTAKAFAFDKSGAIILIDTETGATEVLHETEHSWWGAGVRTLM